MDRGAPQGSQPAYEGISRSSQEREHSAVAARAKLFAAAYGDVVWQANARVSLMTDFYTPQELAERWKISAKTVLRMTESGDLASIRVGKKTRIPAHALSAVEGDTTCTTTNSSGERAAIHGTYTGWKAESKNGLQLVRQMRRSQRHS